MKKVLIADDTKNIRILLSTCLEIEGYEVVTAKDGQEALDLFKNEGFNLAFLDIKMPEISGTEVLKRIRDLGIKTPVIIITAFATVKNAVECTKMGAVAYLQKPFTAEKVRTILKDLENNEVHLKENDTLESVVGRVECLISEKQFSESIALLKKALSQEPTAPHIYHLLSKAYEGIGDTENSKRFYDTYKLFTSSS